MTFLEAIERVFKDRAKMACPVMLEEIPWYGDGIYYDPIHSWMWASGRKAGLPTPPIVFGQWEVLDLIRDSKTEPQ